MKIILIAISALALLLSSCSIFNTDGEPPAEYDSEPPPGYNPRFVLGVKDYNDGAIEKPQAEISGIDVSKPNLVRVKVHIVDTNGNFISGLSKAEYKNMWCKITDSINGKEIILKNPNIYEVGESDFTNLNMAIVMDHSGSMGEYRAEAVQRAVETLISEKKDFEKFSIVKFDGKTVVESRLTDSRAALLADFKRNGLDGFGGMTAIADGIYSGINTLESAPLGQEKALLAFTDGRDNSSKIDVDTVIKAARRAGAHICAVDFGANVNDTYMMKFSDSTSGLYKRIYSTDEFGYIFEDIYNRLKNYYVIEFKPGEFGRHKIFVQICLPNDTLAHSSTYDNTPNVGAIGTLAVNFDYNKATLRKDNYEDIEQVYSMLRAFPKMEIELRGHTDSQNKTGDPEYNIKLSQKRAESVKQALVKMGIDGGRIRAKGLGATQPIADNATEEGRATNRRTEFVILKK